jgi:serine/threonine-protein kinase
MKHCPVCNGVYPNSLSICPQDNAPLRQSSIFEPGRIIRSKYKILSYLGGGGMADVYRVRHIAFNEDCAIKVVKPNFADDEQFNRRFKNEAVLTRRLRHPHAIAVEDFDTTEEGLPYIVMELVQGCDLRTVIKRDGPLGTERTLSIATQVASALAAAGNLGITHRDIKPDNILITCGSDGQEFAKVLDFGIARVKEGSYAIAGQTLTQVGMVVGTPQYMSPEQAQGKLGDDVDCRADIYSLGVVMFEMLTAKLPFISDTPIGYCLEHLHTRPVPPHLFASELKISQTFSGIVMKCLEKRREDRYSTMGELITALGLVAPGTHPIADTTAKEWWQQPCSPLSRFQPEPASATTPPARDFGTALTALPANQLGTPKNQSRVKLWLGLAASAIVVVLGAMYALRPQTASTSANAVSHPPVPVPAAASTANPNVPPSLAVATPNEPPAHAAIKSDTPAVASARARTLSLLHRTLDGRGIAVDCAACPKDKPYVNVVAGGGQVKLQGVVDDDAQLDLIRRVQAQLGDVKGLVVDVHRLPSVNTGAPVAPPVLTDRQSTADQVRANEYVANAGQQMRMGNYVSAEARYQMALDIDPQNEAAKAGLDQARKARTAR